MGLLILFFILSIFFSFLCSILEAVLLSVTPAYVTKSLAEGKTTGKLLNGYKEDIDKPLSAVLTLNTIAHTVGAIGVGAQAGKIFGTTVLNLGFIEISYESIIASLMTLGILVLSEIIPKTLGANNWRVLVPFTVRILRVLILVLGPLVWLSQLITKSFKKDKEGSVLSRSDFAAMAYAGQESGALQESESAIIRNLLEFEKKIVYDIMTPKTVMLMAQEDQSLRDFYNAHQPLSFSRIPIFRDTRDNISGIVLKDDIYQKLVDGNGDAPLKSLAREVIFVNAEMPLPGLFESLTQDRRHLSIATDEFGSVVGVVTMEDLFETLLGKEIVDESDEVTDMQALARKKWEEKTSKGKKS
ncbi:MAG: HlyC/CorC family transporter [Bacteroidia bacterium]|nr:HlyC/CorC family transporter [Bacteroidia bacterium]